MDENAKVLYPNEIDSYLESLEAFDITEIGSMRWFEQQDRVYRLSLQASLDVQSGAEEVVRQEIVVHHKVPVLIHELISTALWRMEILPLIVQSETVSRSGVPLYMVLYHEVTLVSLLETLLFHADVLETALDSLVDLADYCYRRVIALQGQESSVPPVGGSEGAERIVEQQQTMDFESGIKCVSILSCMLQHKDVLPLSVLHRLLVIHDLPLLFTSLACDPPWVRQADGSGQTQRYRDGKWTDVSHGELMKLGKVDGQVWIGLIQLLLDPECQKKYDMSGFRKDQILKLRGKVNEMVMDEIPLLREMLRYLEHLSLFDAPPPRAALVIEQVPEIWDGIRNRNKDRWRDVAEKQRKEHFSLSPAQLQNLCTRLSGSFGYLERALCDAPVCAGCHGRGQKRCSRCRSEWYCGRSCQVSHWTKHKPACDLMASES